MALRAVWGHLLFRFFGADENTLDKARRTALRLAAGLDQTALRRLARDNLTDVIEPIVRWKSGGDADPFKTRPRNRRLVLHDADLHSIRFI